MLTIKTTGGLDIKKHTPGFSIRVSLMTNDGVMYECEKNGTLSEGLATLIGCIATEMYNALAIAALGER